MKTKLYISLFCVGFFWGTTFLGIRVAVETIPPFLVAGFRNILAGSILMIYLYFKKEITPISIKQFLRALLLAFLMIVFANGLTTFAEKYITSGLASIISTLSPFLVLILNLSLGNEKLSLKTLFGIFLGICGIFLIYQNSLSDLVNPEYRLGVLSIVAAVFSWAVGTIITKKGQKKPLGMTQGISIQMLLAGIILFAIQFFVDTKIDFESFSTASIYSVFYLSIFGSVVGYMAYSYLLTQLPSTKVSVLSYVNVVVALFLGWLILDEKITSRIIFATILIIFGVVIVNFKFKKVRK